MARKRFIPNYGTVIMNGTEYYRTRMDIYAKVKYNQPEQLCDVVNTALRQ